MIAKAGVAAMLGLAVCVADVGLASGADLRDAPRRYSPALEQYSWSWFALPPLPRRYQNHCGFANGHFVCSDHCGSDYQIYYCSTAATGCCHIGHGYCDGAGHLRCMAGF
jgi:hypothetical protein